MIYTIEYRVILGSCQLIPCRYYSNVPYAFSETLTSMSADLAAQTCTELPITADACDLNKRSKTSRARARVWASTLDSDIVAGPLL